MLLPKLKAFLQEYLNNGTTQRHFHLDVTDAADYCSE